MSMNLYSLAGISSCKRGGRWDP